MKKFSFIPILLIFFAFADCKKKDTNSKPEQILGTRYSRYNHFIFTKPGAKDKKSQVALIYAFEEVTALEEVTEKGKSFFKVKSVIGKEGFAPSSAYCENVLVITGNDFPAFRKPTITAGIKTELSQAAICFVKENQGEWLFVDCLNIDYNKIKPEFYSSVWIQSKDERIS
ncbi:MAG: lipoprotein LenA, partial [Leptospiraceae bacterium]|nr:lipoprotein LenA [Leptospiraceae bacterium]